MSKADLLGSAAVFAPVADTASAAPQAPRAKPELDAYSIREFCRRHSLTPYLFYKMQRDGLAPKVMQLGGRKLISAEAAARWRKAREQAATPRPQRKATAPPPAAPPPADLINSGVPSGREARTEGRVNDMHSSTYEYLKPTDKQIEQMALMRAAAKDYGDVLEQMLPEGPDKTFIIRAHRSNAMWVNVCLTRHPDGTPRDQL